MEVQDSHALDSNETNVSEPSAGKSSGTHCHDDEITSGRVNSTQTLHFPSGSNIVEIGIDADRQIAEVAKGKSDQKPSQLGDELNRDSPQLSCERKSPQRDVMCSVCLSEYDNKAFLDKCFHAFCYFCILQWSEIVRTCPLCKSSFTSIIHSVKSNDNYQQHYLTEADLIAPLNQSQNDGRRFRYRTTLTEVRNRRQETQREWGVNEVHARGKPALHQRGHMFAQRNRGVIGREKRRSIYTSNLWVQGVNQNGRPRQRDIAPEFFRANPACTHRLIPWVTRDLRVLLNDVESHVGFVLQIILSLITKVELSSEEFCHHLRPFLFDKTEHFIHELVSFARSPFDMNAYDERAQYSWPDESRDQVRETPTVFHSNAADWQSPLPGPSGVSLLELSQTEWNVDSLVPQNEITNWSPTSSPAITSLNTPRLSGTVTISSSSSHSVSIVHLESDATGTENASLFTRTRGPSSETTNLEYTETSRNTRSHRHHRHSHKHKHKNKRKHKRRHSSKSNSSTCGHGLEGDLTPPGPSNRVSVDPSVSDKPVEVIVISDSSVSRDSSETCEDSNRIDLGRKGSRLRSRSRSKNRKKRVSLRKRSRLSPSDCHSVSKGYSYRESRDRSRSRDSFSVSRGLTAERRRKSADRSHSRSRRAKSRYKETHHSKSDSRWQKDVHDASKSSDVKRGKHRRKKSWSRSRSPRRSLSRSKGESGYFKSGKRYSSRSMLASPIRRETTSSSHLVGTSCGSLWCSSGRQSHVEAAFIPRSSLSRSPSVKHISRSPESRRKSGSRSRSRSRNEESVISSTSEPKNSSYCSSENIKREIDDLEHRITADKKRLLQLLIKQERSKGDCVTPADDEKETARRTKNGPH